MASKSKPTGFKLAGRNGKYGFKTIPNESVQWRLQTADGKDFGVVSYDAYKNAVEDTLDSYKPKNEEEKKIIDNFRLYTGAELQTKDGTSIGFVSKAGLKAIEENNVENYTPINDEEDKNIKAYIEYATQKRQETIYNYDEFAKAELVRLKEEYDNLVEEKAKATREKNASQRSTGLSSDSKWKVKDTRTGKEKREGKPMPKSEGDQELERLSNKIAQLKSQGEAYVDTISAIHKYANVVYKDNGSWWGESALEQTKANYGKGRLSQDTAQAYNDYIENPNKANRMRADALSAVSEQFNINNEKAFTTDDENISGIEKTARDWVAESFAVYLPQLVDQTKASIKGAAKGGVTGLIIGTAVPGIGNLAGLKYGIKAGWVAGASQQMYETTRGMVFKNLIDAGYDEETALAAANDEAFISSIIEGVGETISLASLGTGKLISKIAPKTASKVSSNVVVNATKAFAKKTGQTISKNVLLKTTTAVAGVFVNAASEYVEEYSQEAVSVANERRLKNGNSSGKLSLAQETFSVLRDKDEATANRLHSAGVEGFRIGLISGGGIRAGTAIVNRSVYARKGKIIRETDSIQAVIDEGLSSPENTVAYNHAKKLSEKDMDNISDYEIGLQHIYNTEQIDNENKQEERTDNKSNSDVHETASVSVDNKVSENSDDTSSSVTPVVEETTADTPVSPELRNTFTEELNEIASTEMPTVSAGETFIDANTGKTIKIISRDDTATTIEITLNGKTETKKIPNKTADTLAVDDKYTKVETTETTTLDTENEPVTDKRYTVAYTNDNQQIDLSYKVVSIDDLIVSNDLNGKINPEYPQELQPRDRSRVSSQNQIRQMANNLNPARLAESTSVSEGAPIVGPDNVVESGNGRTLAIELAYDIGTADEYRNYIISNADNFGVDVSNIPEKPVLVRERLTAVDRIEFTRKANESSIGSLSATEQATVDAEKLTNDVLNLLVANDDGIINTTDNKDFISSVITKVFNNEDLNNVVNASGGLSARGLERITNAIFYKAYGDASLSVRLSESLDNDMKNATKVLLNVAPKVVSIKNDISAGVLYDFDFSEDIVNAVRLFEACRNNNSTIEDYALQTALFEKESSLVMEMAYVFETKNRGAKQATDFYNLLLDTVEELGNPNQMSFDTIETFQTKGEIFDATVEKFNAGVEPKNTVTIPESIYQSESEQGRENDRRGIDAISRNELNENEKVETPDRVQQDNGPTEEAGIVTTDEQLRQENESVSRKSEVKEESLEETRNKIREKAKKTGTINLDEFGTLTGIPVTHIKETNPEAKTSEVLQNEPESDTIDEKTSSETSVVAKEETATTEVKNEEVSKPEKTVSKGEASKQIADYVSDKLAKGEKISSMELSQIATKAFGGTMANNAFSVKDAYDAMELGVNQYILSMKDVSVDKMLEVLELLPTQTKRTEEQVKFQQFSTPPSIAYLANYTANVNANDIMLEPSAGIGGIAVFAKKDGAKVYVNELDTRRLEVLKNMPFDGFYNENAEQLDNILGGKIEPTVIVMNPPFSSSAERNMKKTKIGASHIEQALKILAPNGRLVAIVGKGMADGEPAFRNWWSDIKSQYNVRANIGINGKNYNKYGTSFDIQMLVIDKNGPTTDTVTGYVDTLQELQDKLGGIRDERPAIDYSANEQRTPTATRQEVATTGKTTDNGNSSVPDTSGRTDIGKSESKRGNSEKSTAKDIQPTDTEHGKSDSVKSENTDVLVDESRRVGSRQSDGLVGETNSTGIDNGNSGQSDIQTRRTEPRNRIKKKELTDSIFEQYQPQPLRVTNAQPHPAKVSESAAMSAIEPPAITYKPNISQEIIDKGVVSDVQLEAISYAGQSHSQTLPNGTTRGFFLGDGTGIGKGRTIAGMILDNYNQGRKKSVWVTLNSSLVNDAKRDVTALFGNSDLVTQFVGGNKADSVLNTDEAIMVISYSALSKGFDNKDSNFEKIVNWLGKDFDGLIVFDEAHKMGNATSVKGTRGVKKASQTGIAGIALQEALPKAKIVYSSATGATEVENLRYAERLGLWGEGTPFVKGDDFVSKVKAGGLAAMELIARDMKAMGVYLSRNISYDDVSYDKITHNITPQQKKIYDELASSWQIVLQNINQALESTNQDKDGHARGRALGAFWSAQQRFFNQILTSMQVPSVISDIEKQLADGKSCVIQLVSTNEAAQNQEFERLKSEDLELDEFDLTPKQVLMSLIENSFPVQQFDEYRDDNGNIRSKPVFDSQGNPVINREAVRQREALLTKLGSIKVPSSPIDMIINHFGTEMVAENTGRARRVIQKDGKTIEEKIGSKKDADVDAFQNGNKRIIIFSKAGGTGKSYHADRSAKNQQQRVHYLLEAGWQADNAVQGFGRSHRSNQAIAPIFKLVTTNLKGQMRFISTIAKRLDQLGAMTKGQRQAGSQGMFSASDNLENGFAADVLAGFYKDLVLNRVDGIDDGLAILEKLGLKNKILDEYNRIIPTASELREVNKFLNRILSLESSEQNTVFDGYSQRLQDATEKAMQAGTLDKGLENYKADKITLNEVQDIREDERSGAKTKYYNLTAEHKVKPVQFGDIPTGSKSFVGFYQNKNTGAVRAVMQTSSSTDQYGNVTQNYKLIGQIKPEYIPQYRLYGSWTDITADEAEKLWNEELSRLPDIRKENLHLISGVVLPVWDKLPTENVRIYRVLTSDGEMLIGRVVSEQMIDETLRRLGSSRKREKIATKDLITSIKSGDKVYLENDWVILQSRVSNEKRIEIKGPSYEHHDMLVEKGVFAERIAYNTRYFIPADTNTEKIIDDILKLSPMMRVESEKYALSIESEGFNDEQSGSDLLPGNSNRGNNASTRKQSERISDFKQKIKGKTKAERRNFAKELREQGKTEEITYGNHQFNIVKPEAYNDDMLSVVKEGKESGKDIGFFIGHGKRKFTDLKIDAVKIGNKVYLRYDGAFAPQTLVKHEDVHIEWDNPEMQKASNIIRNDLSEAEQKKIFAEDRYAQYMDLYKDEENKLDLVWQEFVADVMAGMNDYTSDYIDLVVDYWYDGKVIDRYNPAEYIKSIDAGGNDAVIDNVGFGDEYKISSDNGTTLTKEQVEFFKDSKVRDKNGNLKMVYHGSPNEFTVFDRNKLGKRGTFKSAKLGFYFTDDLTYAKMMGNTKDKQANVYKAYLNIKNPLRVLTTELFDEKSVSDIEKQLEGGNYDGIIDELGNYVAFYPEQIKSIENTTPTDSEDIHYSLSIDNDIEELTSERKKEIFEQFERDRAGVDKPTQRQIWGERAEWVAHNMTRVFPDIPERGEKGIFFAEFRKMMVQWKALPQTSMFMTQDKLNQMTKDLTPDEYKTFSELVYFLDLQEEAQLQKERGYEEILLPNEITPNEVNQIVKVLNEEATANVKNALKKRQQIWDGLKEQYITLNQYIGFDTDGRFNRKNYYHHQVIEYMNQGGKGVAKGKDIEIKAGRGWLKERQGSTKAINTDFLAVEYKAMLQMQYDIYVANMLGKIKDQYDIKPQLEKQAFNHNKELLKQIIAKEATDKDGNIMLDNKGNPDSETYRQQQWYNQRIMFGFSRLFDLAKSGSLPTFSGQYGNVIRALENSNLNVPGLYNYVGELASMELPETATNEELHARIGARTVLKYTSQKKAWVKATLADEYQTWETLANNMKDTHSIHQPRRGNYFYTKTTIDEDAFNKAFNDMIIGLVAGENGIDITADTKKLFEQYSETIRLMGAAFEQWVIPNEIETTMNKVANPNQANVASQVSRALLSAWKGWSTSVNPLRTVKFGVRTIFGDLDAVIAGNPKIAAHSKQAVEEIYQAMKHKKYSPEFMEWVERGGFSSLIFANEMDTEMQDKLFSHLKNKEGLNIFKIPAKLWEGYYNGVEAAHNFREAILRYSAYLYFKNEIIKNGGKVKDNVASNRYIIKGLHSVEDKAYQLSKDLLGAYDEVNAMGQALRRHLIPFYSFTETNLKRYYRLFENIIMSDDSIPKKAGKLLLKTLMVNAFALLLVAWNRLVMKDEDDELPPSVRNIPHLTLGKIGDDVYAFRQLGSFSELLEWVGFEDYKWTKEDLTAPLDKAVGMISPLYKGPVEYFSGLNFYPSITQPRVIRDKAEYIFSTLGLDDVYRVVAGKPNKGIADIVKGSITYSYDYKESAYYEILDIKREYQKNTDNTIRFPTEQENALYYMKTAIRYKDKKSALKYLDEYFENGGTAKGIATSIATLNPMYGYTSEDTIEKGQAFVNSLSDEEKEKLKIAIEYYENDLMLPENVSSLLRGKDITDEQAKNLLRNYINSQCK